MKITLAQMNPCVADLEGNTSKIIASIRQARHSGVDLIVFPELAVTGYPPEDLLLKSHFIDKNLSKIDLIKRQCQDIIAIVGFVSRQNSRIFNSCAVIQDKKIKDIYNKINLPNYSVFDEKRYFSAGESIPVYEWQEYKFSVNICEDIWSKGYVESLKTKSLDFIINISASPFHLGKVVLREKVLSSAAKKLNAFLFYCNLSGGQDELVFDGTSKVFSPKGGLLACAKRFQEDSLEFSLDKNKKYPFKKFKIREAQEAFLALRLGLSDYVKKNGFKKVIVGVSGGIDSAVVAALAQNALGKDNIYGLIMPSQYTSKETFSDAKKICDNLGIKYSVVDIQNIFKVYLDDLVPFFSRKPRDKTEENLQARIRGNVLMAFSNKFGYLVLNTGNKSEVSCGYCTLYGDMVGGFGVLKDVPKMLVYKLAKYINKIGNKKVIPSSIINRQPSAELRPNQKDSDTLPPYNLLDPILKLYIEDDFSADKIARSGFEKELVEKVIRMVDVNEYKRRQAPIGIKITPRAFGKDRRMPITIRK